MSSHLRAQLDIASKLKKGRSNYKKTPKERLTLPYVESRLENLEAQWQLFVKNHHSIVLELTRDEYVKTDYYTSEMYDEIEDEYLQYKVLLKDHINKLKIVNKPDEREPRKVFVKLPEITLPRFSGNYSEWTSYKDLFTSLIHNNGSLDDVQRLHYLKGSLTGEAENLVKSISVSADNYKICWDRLVTRYDNKRSMANSIIRRLMSQKPLNQESANAIRQLLDTTAECLQSLNNIGVDTKSWDLILVYVISQKLDSESRARWEVRMCESSAQLPVYKELEEFMEQRFRSLEYKMTDKSPIHASNSQKTQPKASHVATTVNFNSITCLFCSDKHKLHNCKKFSKESTDARRQFVQTKRLCFNCLSPDHTVYTCTVSTSCRLCKKRHHTLLHVKSIQGGTYEQSSDNKLVAVTTEPPQETETVPEVLTSCYAASRNTVLLATALVHVNAHDSGSASVLRALLNQGSQASFVTESAVQLLRLRKNKDSVRVSGVGDSTSLESKSSVNIKLTSRSDPAYSLTVKAYVLEKLTALLPSKKVSIDASQMKELPSLELADPSYNQPGKIDLLLGAEVYSNIMMDGLLQGSGGRFIAQKTKLGWILSGVVEDSKPNEFTNQKISCHTITIDEEINNDMWLKRFWELESEPTLPSKILTQEESACEELFTTTTTRDESGRYVVKLPFKNEDPACKYGEFKNIATKRFLMLEKRLLSNPTLKVEYSKVINEYLTLGHMEECTDKNNQTAVYLPHHAVIREDKNTTKVRVVFDASCKGINGASLNSELMVGPTLQPELRHLVMRWRCHPISIVADIVKMYRQIKVAAEDTDFQRIIWRDNPSEPLQHYRLLRVTFGTSSAPYLAVRTLQQVAYDEREHLQEGASKILSDFYVDDLMTGCHSVAEGLQVFKEITELLGRAGFVLQKWSSNNKELLEMIGSEDSDQNFCLKTDEVMKVLGLTWNKDRDEFHVKVNLSPLSDGPVTKRKVISDIAKLFDPLGWLAPTIIIAKVFIQRLWLSGIGWDEHLPTELLNDWLAFKKDLVKLESFGIPRWIQTNKDDEVLELHGFADASNVAYAAVVHARVVDKHNNVYVHLISSKTRLAPIKQVSIPRLELCGATLLAKLLNEIGTVLKVEKRNIHAWSDSTIVLAWLSSHPSRWKTFVGNRVSEILTTMDGNQWSHVSSEDNAADCASRGLNPTELVQNEMWKRGPTWLHDIEIKYNKKGIKDTHLEEKKTAVKCHAIDTVQSDDHDELLSKFSSLQKLTRVVAFCRRVLCWGKPEIKKAKKFENRLTAQELNDSINTCIRICQGNQYRDEIESLQSSGKVSKKSKLLSLDPYLDDNQILRVSGRLQNASLQEDMKHPIIIPHNGPFTTLLIDEAHKRTLHGGPQLMLNYLRSKYWVIGAKNLVRQFVRKCVTCVRHSGQVNQQMMGQLPKARVTPHRAFYRTGVDYAGPINVRATKGRGHHSTKGYICVFVCMATKAIHLEVVSDMTSEAFLAAFKRFVARRGHVAELWSDNGSTFVGAARQLSELFDVESSTVAVEIADWLSSNGTAWHFIPPHSPNFGGLWEAAVKSTKFHLARVIGTSTLTFEEMTTTLAQIEACLNSRPMSQLSSDPNDACPLTPGHFLVGEPLVLVPDINYEASNIASLKRWHLIQRMTQDFWRRWSQEYLTQLQNRYKWTDRIPEPGIGAVVLIKEDGLPPARWLYGIVVEKHPGQDGLTRVVSLKCKGHILKRPVSKLIVLPNTN